MTLYISSKHLTARIDKESDLCKKRKRMVGLANSNGSATILIGMPMDEDESKELLSWAISVLSHPNATVVALHVLEGEEPKKLSLTKRHHKQYQRSKAFVISVMAEFAKICESRQVYLQARVRYCSSVEKGLIKEAKMASADFVVLGGSKVGSKGMQDGVAKYCYRHAPKGCSIMSIGRFKSYKSDFKSDLTLHEDQSESTMKSSPRTVLIDGAQQGASPTSDDNSSSDTILKSVSSVVLKKQNSTTVKRIASSLLRLPFTFPFELYERKKAQTGYTSYQDTDHMRQPALRCFSYQEMSRATNDFHLDNMVGRGGYSEVYKGEVIDGNTNTITIAVKRLAKDNANPRKETDFLMELGVIGHVSHPNTAGLLGYCVENGLYLVFNYSANGNLSNALHGGESSCLLEWDVRYKIAMGVARGLHYLHKCCKHKIIHRDITASNVLLGLDYEPQITDFGLAKWVPSKGSNNAVGPIIEGTFGYLAPEYFMHGLVDEKTDVYAFGVLLLEIMSARMPVDHLTKQSLLLWAIPLIESGKIEDLVDPRLQGRYEVDQVHRLVLVASHCVQQSASRRPSMNEVLEILEESYGGEDLGRSREMPKILTEEVNDYSMPFGYSCPIDFNLDDEEEVW